MTEPFAESMLSKPLVSICIPTYNRVDILQQTLDSIVCQKEFEDGLVEVVVSDNCSTDETEWVVRKYAYKYHGLRYHRNKENILDRNFPLVMSLGRGTLRKLSNDSASYVPGGLRYLCDMTRKYCDKRPLLFFSNQKAEADSGEAMLSFQEFMRKESFNITWIGSFSLWEDDCENLLGDPYGCDLRLWQVQRICEVGVQKNAVALCNQRIIQGLEVPKKDISYGLWQVFYINYFSIIDQYVSAGYLSEDDRKYLEKDLLYGFFKQWIIQWELSQKDYHFSSKENLKTVVFNHYSTKPYWRNFLLHYHASKTKARLLRTINNVPKGCNHVR